MKKTLITMLTLSTIMLATTPSFQCEDGYKKITINNWTAGRYDSDNLQTTFNIPVNGDVYMDAYTWDGHKQNQPNEQFRFETSNEITGYTTDVNNVTNDVVKTSYIISGGNVNAVHRAKIEHLDTYNSVTFLGVCYEPVEIKPLPIVSSITTQEDVQDLSNTSSDNVELCETDIGSAVVIRSYQYLSGTDYATDGNITGETCILIPKDGIDGRNGQDGYSSYTLQTNYNLSVENNQTLNAMCNQTDGEVLVITTLINNNIAYQNCIVNGTNGISAYDIAVSNGFIGTEQEWLESLHGTDGVDGTDGNISQCSCNGCNCEVTSDSGGVEVIAYGLTFFVMMMFMLTAKKDN